MGKRSARGVAIVIPALLVAMGGGSWSPDGSVELPAWGMLLAVEVVVLIGIGMAARLSAGLRTAAEPVPVRSGPERAMLGRRAASISRA